MGAALAGGLLGVGNVGGGRVEARTCWSGSAGNGCAETPSWGNQVCGGNKLSNGTGAEVCTDFVLPTGPVPIVDEIVYEVVVPLIRPPG